MSQHPVEEMTFAVPGMTCGHCVSAVHDGIASVPGVTEVRVDLDSKVVVVHGEHIDHGAVFAAVEDAGYEAVTGNL
jgi:copper chaperone CopZ